MTDFKEKLAALQKKTSTNKAIDKEHIIANLREVYVPEISINVYDLGLINDIDIEGSEV